jgi:hypothetical protein
MGAAIVTAGAVQAVTTLGAAVAAVTIRVTAAVDLTIAAAAVERCEKFRGGGHPNRRISRSSHARC